MKVRLAVLIIAILLVTAATASASEKPMIGVCIIFSPNILSDKDNQASLAIKDAVYSKFGAAKYDIDQQVTPADFKNYLGKKDMLVSEVPQMINTLKLPVFVNYGSEKQLDYLTMVFCQAVTHKSTTSTVQAQKNKTGTSTTYSTINSTMIKKVDLITRVVVVDIKKQEYVYNFRLDKTVDDDPGFHTEVRAIRVAAKEYAQDFAQQITAP